MLYAYQLRKGHTLACGSRVVRSVQNGNVVTLYLQSGACRTVRFNELVRVV